MQLEVDDKVHSSSREKSLGNFPRPWSGYVNSMLDIQDMYDVNKQSCFLNGLKPKWSGSVKMSMS